MAEGVDALSPALESVLSRCANAIHLAGQRHGLAAHEIDEVVQEVRIRLWHALASREKIEQAPASYVYRTAASAALDLIRRRRARREDPVDTIGPSATASVAPLPGPDLTLERRELIDQINRALDALGESRRPVVRMFLAGYHLEEIAQLLGWSGPKTRNLLYRGLADLRELLTEQGVRPGVGR